LTSLDTVVIIAAMESKGNEMKIKEYFCEAFIYKGSAIRILSRGLSMKSKKVAYIDGAEIGEYSGTRAARKAAKSIVDLLLDF